MSQPIHGEPEGRSVRSRFGNAKGIGVGVGIGQRILVWSWLWLWSMVISFI